LQIPLDTGEEIDLGFEPGREAHQGVRYAELDARLGGEPRNGSSSPDVAFYFGEPLSAVAVRRPRHRPKPLRSAWFHTRIEAGCAMTSVSLKSSPFNNRGARRSRDIYTAAPD
jgi:hypothetical protein